MKFKEYLGEDFLIEGKDIISDLIFPIEFQKKLGKKDYDPETKKLMIQVVRQIQKELKVDLGIADAIQRLNAVADGNFSQDMNRNHIFKAAKSLGMKTPSMSF